MVTIYASNTIRYSSEGESATSSTSPTTVKTYTTTEAYTGSIRIHFRVYDDYGLYVGYAQIYVNGSPWGVLHDATESGHYWEGDQNFSGINLASGSTIQIRAYISGAGENAYVSRFRIQFDYVGIPTVTTQAVTSVGTTTAIGNGNVTLDGGSTITQRGVCWDTSTNPTTANYKATATGTTGAYTVSMTGLSPSTHYFVKAYAINTYGTSYGSEVTFDTGSTVKKDAMFMMF
jgi:hypothetical protein